MVAWILAVLGLFIVQTLMPATIRYVLAGAGMAQRLRVALGSRDDQPPLSLLGGRAQRALDNMHEALPVFLTLAILHVIQQTAGPLAGQGAALFLLARVLYVPAYLSGIPGVRSTTGEPRAPAYPRRSRTEAWERRFGLRAGGAMDEAWRRGHAVEQTRLSPKEYLAFERAAEGRHEYANGEIFAMSGGTIEHSAIAGNIARELGIALSDRGCLVLNPDMRIHVVATSRYVYADASVLCENPLFLDDRRDTILNPKLVVEVLSDSSEAYDRGDKFAGYRTIASLRTYVLASQKEPRVEVFSRQPDGSWLLRVYGPGERAALPDIDTLLDVDRVYRGVLELLTGASPKSA